MTFEINAFTLNNQTEFDSCGMLAIYEEDLDNAEKYIAELKAKLAASEALRQDLSDQANDYQKLYGIALQDIECRRAFYESEDYKRLYEMARKYVDVDWCGEQCISCHENITCDECLDKYFREQLRKEKE